MGEEIFEMAVKFLASSKLISIVIKLELNRNTSQEKEIS